MTSYDNAPPLDGWTVPTGSHCGDYCWGPTCPVCGEPAGPPKLHEGIVLGEN